MYCKRHVLRRFIAGIAEHQALVAGALLEIQPRAFVDATRDVGRLLVIGDEHGAATIVDAIIRVVVTYALDRVARGALIVDILGGRRDFSGQHHESGIDQRFRRNAGKFVLR